MPDLVECQRCHEPVPTSQLLEHLRLLHPDVDAEPGDTVATDLTEPTEVDVIAMAEHPLIAVWQAGVSAATSEDFLDADGELNEAMYVRYALNVMRRVESEIRAKVAAEIRAESERIRPAEFAQFDGLVGMTSRGAYANAAKIAEGSTDG